MSNAILFLLVACEKTPVDGVPDVRVTKLEIDPPVAVVETGPEGGEPVQFSALATFFDGTTSVLDAPEWTISNRSSGTIDAAGLFSPSATNGGISYVLARFDGVEAQADLTVVYADEVVEAGADPRGFDQGVVPWDMWVYPEDGVNFPRNTPSIQFQWSDIGATTYRLRFRSDTTDLSVYTTGTSWTADAEQWPLIVSTNAGGSVEVELSGVVGIDVYQDAPRTLNVNRLDAEGSIYYWSTSAQGIKQIPYGESASDFMTAATSGHCVGCHDMSSTGLISFTYDGGNGALGIKHVSDQSDVVPYGSGLYGNFQTFSPDGRFLLVAYQAALLLDDAVNGTYLWPVAADGPATQPDWSPDGTQVVFVSTTGWSCDWCFTGGRIAVMDHLGDGTFGAPRIIFEPPAGYNAYYPVFSPDGEWIAFDMSTGDAYDDTDAAIYVMPAAGGAPFELASANQALGLTNSWPRWAPLPDDSVLWLAFASRRNYGNVVSGMPQIWVAGFDPERARRGEDPSWPAFWLPGQDTTQGNHIPFWNE